MSILDPTPGVFSNASSWAAIDLSFIRHSVLMFHNHQETSTYLIPYPRQVSRPRLQRICDFRLAFRLLGLL